MIGYSHWDTGGKLKNMYIGLATLRIDGFGSLSPKVAENDAHFITSTFTAKQISINLEGLTPESPLTVQLLGNLDHVLDGYEAQMTTNGVRVPVTFSKPLPAGQKIALRVKYPVNSGAKTYAVYFHD